MAYEHKNLSVLAYANRFTLWHFTTTDPATVVSRTGYFNDAAKMIQVGDMILANVDVDGDSGGGIFLVKGNADGVVDVSDLTPVGAWNTD